MASSRDMDDKDPSVRYRPLNFQQDMKLDVSKLRLASVSPSAKPSNEDSQTKQEDENSQVQNSEVLEKAFLDYLSPTIDTPEVFESHLISAATAHSSPESSGKESKKNKSAALEIDLEGNVKYLSKSWETFVGTPVRKIVKKNISKFIIGNEDDQSVFKRATEIMKLDDTSYKVRFIVAKNTINVNTHNQNSSDDEFDDDDEEDNSKSGSSTSQEDYDSNDVTINNTMEEGFNANSTGINLMPSTESSKSFVLSTSAEQIFSISSNAEMIGEVTRNSPAQSEASSKFFSDDYIELEGQGILIHDFQTQQPTHSMWLLRPYVEHELLVELPSSLIDILGFGSELFVNYLQTISFETQSQAANSSTTSLTFIPSAISDNPDPDFKVPDPIAVLCNICEAKVPDWWLERHSELCYLDSKAESDLQIVHDNIAEHKLVISSIVKGEILEYKDFKLPPIPAPSVSKGVSDTNGLRFPLRTLHTLATLCDEAFNLDPVDFEEENQADLENEISHMMEWQIPKSNDKAINALIDATELLANQKADAILRVINTHKLHDRLKKEVDSLVMGVIRETLDAIKDRTNLASQHSRKNSEIILDHNKSTDSINFMTPSLNNSSDFIYHYMEREASNKNYLNDSPNRSSPLRQDSLNDRQPSRSSIDSKRFFLNDLQDSQNHNGLANMSHSSSVNNSLKDISLLEPVTAATASSSSSLLSNVIPMSHSNSHNNSNSNDSSDLGLRKKSKDIFQPIPTSSTNVSISIHGSPRRPYSPQQIPPHIINSPLTSIQRNNRSQSNLGGDSRPNTANSSPLLLGLGDSNSLSNVFSDYNMNTKYDLPKPPLSPLLVSSFSINKPVSTQPSIKDYEIIKPISKGAFGHVYLARKRISGEYVAIKVLKKSDMIAKNQVTNIKSERAIMMAQSDSPYVAKLFSTFQTKSYLFLVMEYLIGGDCASLLKMLGSLPESWAKRYIAEIVIGVDDLHKRGIIHRDLKPDNFLIDGRGHLKLTDFGLSKMGLVSRQYRHQNLVSTPDTDTFSFLNNSAFSNSPSALMKKGSGSIIPIVHDHKRSVSHTSNASSTDSSNANLNFTDNDYLLNINNNNYNGVRSTSLSYVSYNSPSTTNNNSPTAAWFENLMKLEKSNLGSPRIPEYGSSNTNSPANNSFASALGTNNSNNISASLVKSLHKSNSQASFLIASDSSGNLKNNGNNDSSPVLNPLALDDSRKHFVGTPDYLAPETIKGTNSEASASGSSDWWSLGCILFEFLFGYPPFHASTISQVFENITQGNVDWPDFGSEESFSEICSTEAKDLIIKLLNVDPEKRLGTNGSYEIMTHPFFNNISWDTLWEDEASFIPVVDDPEDTDYFDSRGAEMDINIYEAENDIKKDIKEKNSMINNDCAIESRSNSNTEASTNRGFTDEDDHKLKVLFHKNDNDNCGSNFRDEEHQDGSSEEISISQPLTINSANRMLLSPSNIKKERRRSTRLVNESSEFGSFQYRNLTALEKANRNIINRLKSEHIDYKTSSSSSSSIDSVSATRSRGLSISSNVGSSSKPSNLPAVAKLPSSSGTFNSTKSAIDDEPYVAEQKFKNAYVLLCDPIPIFRYSIKKMLESFGCKVVGVGNGDELIRKVTGRFKYDVIFSVSEKLEKVSVVDVVKLIRNTDNANSLTPIIAITSFYKDTLSFKLFDDIIEKPVTETKIEAILSKYVIIRIDAEAAQETSTVTTNEEISS